MLASVEVDDVVWRTGPLLDEGRPAVHFRVGLEGIFVVVESRLSARSGERPVESSAGGSCYIPAGLPQASFGPTEEAVEAQTLGHGYVPHFRGIGDVRAN